MADFFIFHKRDNSYKVNRLLENNFKYPLSKKLSFHFFNSNRSIHIGSLIKDCNKFMKAWHQDMRIPTIGFHTNLLRLNALNKLRKKDLYYFRKVTIHMNDIMYYYLKFIHNGEFIVFNNEIAVYNDDMLLFRQYG